MYFDTHIEYKLEMIDQRIESEMHKVKENIFTKLSHYFAHSPFSIEDLLLTIAYGYFESHKSAENLADKMNLCKLDFLAIQEDFEGFKEEYLKDLEKAENF